MTRWRDRSARFQRNMYELASEDFTPEPDFEAPAVLNPYEKQVEALSTLKDLIEGIESGKYRLDTLNMNVMTDDFTVNNFSGVPVTLPGNATAIVEMRVTVNPNI